MTRSKRTRGATSIEYAVLIVMMFTLGAAGAKALGAVTLTKVTQAAERFDAPRIDHTKLPIGNPGSSGADDERISVPARTVPRSSLLN